jgi:hypothetical protein
MREAIRRMAAASRIQTRFIGTGLLEDSCPKAPFSDI